MLKVTLNEERRLYVTHFDDDSCSCLGFDNAFEQAEGVALWLRLCGEDVAPPDREAVGTEAGWLQHVKILGLGQKYADTHGVRCPALLCTQLLGHEGKQVEVVDKYDEKRRFYVGKSTGWLPTHLELEAKNSPDGPAVSGDPFKQVRLIMN